jgi:hypothetical protein
MLPLRMFGSRDVSMIPNNRGLRMERLLRSSRLVISVDRSERTRSMSKASLYTAFLLSFLLLVSVAGSAQAPAQPPDQALKQPLDVDDNFLQSLGAAPQFGIEAEKTAMSMSEAAKLAQQQNRIFSVPTFTKSFTFQGQSFPFTMVGRAPEKGETTGWRPRLFPSQCSLKGLWISRAIQSFWILLP